MRILSIDLPWSSAAANFGFAWCDAAPRSSIESKAHRGGAASAAQIFSAFAAAHGKFDVVLVDQPIGGMPRSGFRDVERAFTNSSFVQNGAARLQAPKFQPGAPHTQSGFRAAQLAQELLGTASVIVVESFPQLSIPALIGFSTSISGMTSLASHKRTHGTNVGRQLIAQITSWTQRLIVGDAALAQPDAVDATLALLPAIATLAPWPNAPNPVWLHTTPAGAPPLPSTVSRSQKPSTRAQWLAPMALKRHGPPGIRTDGILGMCLSDWPVPRQPPRVL